MRRISHSISLALCVAVMAAGFIAPAAAQSTNDLVNRLNRMENELQTLNRAVYKGEAPPRGSLSFGDGPAASADAQVRLQQLEIELRDMRGKMEQQDHEIRQMKSQLERTLSDLEVRLDDAGNGGAAPSGSASRYTASPSPSPAPVSADGGDDFTWSSGTARQGSLGQLGRNGTATRADAGAQSAAAAYENAFALIKNGQYKSAEKAFQKFLNENPSHALSGNAKYWLGESYYVRGDYAQSARVFAEGYKQYPKGAKAPDNLLKLGLSLAGMGNKDDACVALGQLTKEYAAGSLPVLRRAEQEMKKLSCV